MATPGPNSQLYSWSLSQSSFNEGESIRITLNRSLASVGSRDRVWLRLDDAQAADFNLSGLAASSSGGATWLPVNFGSSLSTAINLPIAVDSLSEGGEFVVLGLSGEAGRWVTSSSTNGIVDWEVNPSSQFVTINDTVAPAPVPAPVVVAPAPAPAPLPAPVVVAPLPNPVPVLPAAPTDPFLSFQPAQLPGPPTNPALSKFYDYVDRYPLSLKAAFIADYKAGKAPSQHLWGQQHWLNSGKNQGRVLEIVDGAEDVNDYAAYVENYGTTLLDLYRKSPDSNPASPSFKSLFNWGKNHYLTLGKSAGRLIDGGADWGAIVIQNFDLYTRWQDAQITTPGLSAFAFGYRNQNVVKSTLGVKVGRDTSDRLSGQYVYALGGNDVISGTSNDDILSGGFGDDLIIGGSGGNDTAYGGPGLDVFRIASGGNLNIRDFRKGSDFIQLGNGLSEASVSLVFDGLNNATLFKVGGSTIASVYGTNPNTFSFADESDGIANVFI